MLKSNDGNYDNFIEEEITDTYLDFIDSIDVDHRHNEPDYYETIVFGSEPDHMYQPLFN